MTLILVLGLVSLFSGCAFNRHLIVMDKEGKIIKERTVWGDNTIAVLGKDGSVTVINDRYPPPGSYSSKEDKKGVISSHGTYPAYPAYGYGGYYRGYYGQSHRTGAYGSYGYYPGHYYGRSHRPGAFHRIR